jgi:uncharacterized repeat protein (TIGR01451 family)
MIPGKKLASRKIKIRPFTPVLIVAVCLLAAVAFSISVESRSGGWLRRNQPTSPQINAERTNNSRSNSSSVNRNAVATTRMLTPPSPTVTASKTDTLLTDVDNDGKADPGDTLKYTVTIGATGADATGVNFTDTVDPNTTFVAGSLRTTPLARPDSYTATGNVRIQVPAPGVLGNDSDPDGIGPAISVTAGASTSAQGGDVTMNADGSFAYNPPAGFEGTDTFTYTLNDNDTPNNTDTGTVSVTVSGMIWFINNNVGSSGDGRLTNPFKTLADFQAVNNGTGNHPAANDNIFVYESATDYVGPVTLLNGQKFIGQDATASLASIAGITLAPNSDPLPATNSGNGTIVNITSAGNGINLGQNNTLRGFTGGNAASDIDGSSFGTANISDVTLNGNGEALNLSNGALNGTFGSISATNSATTGISLTSVGGSLSTGSTTVTNSTGIGINVNTSSATLNFANTSVTGSGNTGISLTTDTGTITFGSLTITPDSGQRALLATENTNTITATSGSISTTNATAVEITKASGATPLVISLTSVSANGGTNGIKLSRTSGSFTVNGTGTSDGTGGTIQSTTNRGADFNNATNITLKNMHFTNAGTTDLDSDNSGLSTGDNLATNAAINLISVTTVTLDDVIISGGEEQGINGNTVSSFNLTNSSITNVGNAADEDNIHFYNMSGTCAITNTTLTHTSGGGDDNLNLQMQSGTLTLTISGGSAVGTAGGVNQLGSGYLFGIRGTSNATINITNGSSTNNFSGGIVADAFDTATMNLNVTNSTSSGNNDDLSVSAGDSSNVNLNATGNTLSAVATGDFVPLGLLGSALDTGYTFDAVISGNTISVANGLASDGIVVNNAGGGAINASITGNTITYAGTQRAILVQAGQDGNGTNNITITGNSIDVQLDGAGNAVAGFLVQNAITGPGNTSSMCADLGGATTLKNTFTHSLGGNMTGGDIRVRQRNDGTMRLPGYGGAATDTAAVVAYLAGRNTLVNSPTATATADSSGFAGGAACTQPTLGPVVQNASLASKSGSLSADTKKSDKTRPETDILNATDNYPQRPEGEQAKLTDAQLAWMVQVAMSIWQDAGVSAADIQRMQAMKFEIADLPRSQLAVTTSSLVKIDETAASYGWFVDVSPLDNSEFEVPVPGRELQVFDRSMAAEHIDLLTVVLRSLAWQLSDAKRDSFNGRSAILSDTLPPGVRRVLTGGSTAKKEAPKPNTNTAIKNNDAKLERENQVASVQTPRNSRVNRHHARLSAPTVFADVSLSIGDIPAGHTITVTFNATVKDPFPGPGAQVCNQGSVSGSNFSTVLTDDPDVVGTADPTCTNIDLQADLAVTKTDSPDPVVAGTDLTYTIDFVNNGPNASGATVTDATPAGTTFVSASVISGTGWGAPTTPAVGGTGNVVFSNASVANGGTAQFQIVVHVASSVAPATIITNNATAATTGATDPVPGNNTGTATTTVVAHADLSITKTDGVTSKVPGTSVTYTIVVSNGGPSDANGVSAADTFPSDLTGVTFTSVAAGGATGNTAAGAGNISDTLNMPTGSSVTYTVNATVKSSATGSLSNTATVTAPGNVTDPTLGNNTSTDTDTLTPQADLSITKSDGATTAVPGSAIVYTITVTNPGPSDAPGTTVADTFPSDLTGVTFTSVGAGGATGNTAAGSGNINDTAVNLPSGSSVTYTVNATVKSSATGSLSNTATVTAAGSVTDPTPGNNSSTDTDTLTPHADLSITKTDGVASKVPGTSVTYTIVVTNNGPSDAPGTTVGDTFPGILSGVTFTSVAAGGATGNTAAGSGNINDTLSMPSGSSVTYTVNATVSAAATGTLSNTATVAAGGGVTDPTPGNNSATDTDTLTPSADVSVTKTDSPDPVVVGNNITYTITVTNNGASDAQTLSLSDAVPANTTLVSVTTPSGWSRTDAVPAGGTGTLTFTRATQAASASSIFTVVVNVNAGTANGTTITNTANVSSATTDPTPGNNSAIATTLVQSNADVAISKTRSPNTASIDAGNNVTYTINVINNGPAAASSASFSDTVPAGLEVVSQSNPAGWTCNTLAVGSNGTITCTKGTMANGETAQLTVTAKVSCSDANGATITNNAGISAASPSDNVPGNNNASTSFTVNNPAVTVTASVALSQLPQNTHELINVGLSALASGGTTNCPPGPLTVQVFGDEDDQTPTAKNEVFSPDAKDIAVSTLRLRAERVNTGDGRVYLIVVRSGSSFATVTVTVPKSSSPSDGTSVANQAAAAKSYADSHNGAAPAGYFVIGDGPTIGNKQ